MCKSILEYGNPATAFAVLFFNALQPFVQRTGQSIHRRLQL